MSAVRQSAIPLKEPPAEFSGLARRPGQGWALPALIVLLALALRIFHLLHESVSGDEAFSITLTRDPLGVMMHRLVVDLVHPPLHYLALRAWLEAFGFGLLPARALSVIFGTLAIVFLYLLAEYLFDRRTALLAALLMAMSQLAIMFSQEARPYAQMHLLALACSYLFLRAWREERAVYWWAFVGTSVVMLYTDYFGLFLIAALLLLAWVYRRRYPLRLGWVAAGAIVGLVLYTPWLTSGIARQALKPGSVARQSADYSAVHSWTIFSIVNSFNNGKPAGLRSDSPWWSYVVGGLLFSAPLLLLLNRLMAGAEATKGWKRRASARRIEEGKKGALSPGFQPAGAEARDLKRSAVTGLKPGASTDREGIVIAGILCAMPILLTLLLGKAFHVPYNVRYVSFCAAFYYVLVARAIFELPFSTLRWGVVALILLYSANSLRANYFLRWKENWDAAYAYVASHRQPGDCGMFPPDLPQQQQPWEVTQGEGPPLLRIVSPQSVASGSSGCERLWEIVAAPRDDWRYWKDYKKNRDPIPATFTKLDEQRFYAVRLALYSFRPQ